MKKIYCIIEPLLQQSHVKSLLLLLLLGLAIPSNSRAQDYMINRGVFASSYTGGMRMCVVDKNEYYQPYALSNHCAVRQYKNGIVSQYGTTTTMPPMAGNSDIAFDSASKVMYVGFFSSDYDSIYTFKKGASDPDWVLVTGMLKPASNLLGYTLRLSFNKNGGKLFMGFSEQTSGKIYLYELASGTWTNRTGATAMACYNSWFDLVSYGNKVILTSTPLVGARYTLRVHVWDITTSSITTLPDWNNGLNYTMSSFATTAYNVYANEYITFLSSNYIPKALKSAAGGAWTDISTGLTGSVDNGSWGCYIVFNNLMSRYTAFFSSSSLKGYSWDGTTWTSLTMPYMSSSNTFATSNYKDAYFLAWASGTQVGIYTPNETPFRNTMNIASTPGITTCDLLFPDRGVGNKVVVFVKQGTYVAPVTADNTTYTANTAFGSGTQLGSSGWYCVYNGVGQALTITGLTQGTTYQVQALEYNGLPGAEMYMGTAAVTGNPISFATTGPSCANPTSGGTIAAAQTVCSGGTPSPFTSTASPSGETGIIEYKWQFSTTGSSSGFNDIASSNSATYAPGTLSVNTWYKRVARVTCKADWIGAAESNVIAVTINPAGQVDQPVNQVVCNNGSTTAVTFTTTNTGGTTTYAWTNSATSIGLAASGTGNIASFTALNTGTLPVVATIVVTPTFTNGSVGCAGPTKTFTITVNPTGQVNQPASEVLCNGSLTTAVSFVTVNTGGTTTYAWTNSATSIGLAASGTGNIASFTAVNTGTLPVVATIVVTPTFTNGSVGCAGPTKTFTITVNPTGQVNQPVSQVVCHNTATTAVTFGTTNTGGTTTYAWTNSTPSIGLAASGTGNIASFTALNTGSSPVVATIVVTPTFTNGSAGCAGPTKTFTITVNPVSQPTIAGITNLCVNSGYYNYTTEPGMTGYLWTLSAGGTITWGAGTNQVQVVWNSAGAQTVSVIYTNPNACSGASPTVLPVTVNPMPGNAGNISGPATACGGSMGIAYTTTPIANAVTYVWYLPAGATIATGAGTPNITVNFAWNASSGNISVSGNNLCGYGNSSSLMVGVTTLPDPASSVTGSASVCEGAHGVVFSVNPIANATGYTWTLPAGAVIASGTNTNSITVDFATTSGNITVKGTNSCGNGSVSPAFAVTVTMIPETPVVTNSNDTVLSSAATGNQWFFSATQTGAGTIIPGATGQTYQALQTGWYYSVVTVNGCSSGESNRVYVVMVGIGELQASGVVIYPVPNRGIFTASISSPTLQTVSLQVYNMTGQLIYRRNDLQVKGTLNQQIDLTPVRPGVYTVVISDGTSKIIRRIIIGN